MKTSDEFVNRAKRQKPAKIFNLFLKFGKVTGHTLHLHAMTGNGNYICETSKEKNREITWSELIFGGCKPVAIYCAMVVAYTAIWQDFSKYIIVF